MYLSKVYLFIEFICLNHNYHFRQNKHAFAFLDLFRVIGDMRRYIYVSRTKPYDMWLLLDEQRREFSNSSLKNPFGLANYETSEKQLDSRLDLHGCSKGICHLGVKCFISHDGRRTKATPVSSKILNFFLEIFIYHAIQFYRTRYRTKSNRCLNVNP